MNNTTIDPTEHVGQARVREKGAVLRHVFAYNTQ